MPKKSAIPTFVPHKAAETRRASALRLVEVIAPLEIDEPIKRKMLSHSLWFVTETEGTSKYRTRFMSRRAVRKIAKRLHHEHVIPRKVLVDAMMREPHRAAEIANTAIGCTVTRKEHEALAAVQKTEPSLEGWDRYRRAGIEVIDTATGEPIQ